MWSNPSLHQCINDDIMDPRNHHPRQWMTPGAFFGGTPPPWRGPPGYGYGSPMRPQFGFPQWTPPHSVPPPPIPPPPLPSANPGAPPAAQGGAPPPAGDQQPLADGQQPPAAPPPALAPPAQQPGVNPAMMQIPINVR